MPSRNLIASDGSVVTKHLVSCLPDLRKVGAREVTLARVFNVATVGAVSDETKQHFESLLRKQAGVLEAAGYATRVELPWGVPFLEIADLAEKIDASLIAVASHGRSLVTQTMLGSTARAIVEHARRPVLIVRLALRDTAAGKTECALACADIFYRVLFATDFSETAERAFQFLEHIVRETRAPVTLLHVQDRSHIGGHLQDRLEEFNRIDTARLERQRERLLAVGATDVDIAVPYGHPSQEIIQRAAAKDHSLVVMGTHGRGFVEELLLGSVALKIARRVSILMTAYKIFTLLR